ncbi:MAG: YecA/YgfB family protein [Steroidobacteraceae bacterium]
MSGTVSPSLAEAEVERLAALLAANRNPGALSLEGVDGFFCALIASPALVMPHEYLPVILGGTLGEGGLIDDLVGVQEMMGLLMRLWNAIAHDFEHETFHVAHRDELGEDGVPGRAWARGYLRGTRLAPHGWDRIFEDEHEGLLLAVPLAAGEVDPAWPKKPLTEEQSSAMWTDMLAGAARAYRYFKEDRLAYAQAADRRAPTEPYERAGPKVGRNDPCPCGSGKKYKRCCGAPESGDRVVH